MKITFVLTVLTLVQIVIAETLYPTDLISKIRFYHLQEPFYHYENERALTQCETYLAQDLAESIEDVCFILGMTSNPLFLPENQMTIFEISQRFGRRFHFISMFQLQALVFHKAYETFKRQKDMDSSAVMIDDLENDWIAWWGLVQRSVPSTHLQFMEPMPSPRRAATN